MTDDEYTSGLVSLKNVCKTPEGRRAIKFLLDDTGFFTSAISGDPYRDSFFSGRRSVALSVDSYVGRDAFLQILKEPL